MGRAGNQTVIPCEKHGSFTTTPIPTGPAPEGEHSLLFSLKRAEECQLLCERDPEGGERVERDRRRVFGELQAALSLNDAVVILINHGVVVTIWQNVINEAVRNGNASGGYE